MKLEALSKIEGSAERFRVRFDDGNEIKVSSAQIADFGLYSGREMSGEEYSELLDGLALSSAKSRALRILGSRNMSSREVEKRLVRKGVGQETAEETARWLEDIGAVNDEEFAAMIVSHYAGKGYGLARIKNELFRRGIERELWDDALAQLDSFDDAALAFLEKKLRGASDKDLVRRACDALYRRGFARDEVRAAVGRYMENIEETEDFEQ